MANHQIALTDLSVDLSSSGQEPDRLMTITVNFTEGTDDWEISLPSMNHDEIRHLVYQFQHAISRETETMSLGEGDDWEVELI